MPASNITVVPKTISTDGVTIDTNEEEKIRIRAAGIEELTNGSNHNIYSNTTRENFTISAVSTNYLVKEFTLNSEYENGKVQVKLTAFFESTYGNVWVELNGNNINSPSSYNTGGSPNQTVNYNETNVSLEKGNNVFKVYVSLGSPGSTPSNFYYENFEINTTILFKPIEQNLETV